MRDIFDIGSGRAQAEPVLLRDLMTALQKCRCILAILIAVLNKQVYRHEQARLAVISSQLEEAVKFLNDNRGFKGSRFVPNKENIMNKLENLYGALRELEEWIVRKWNISKKVSELLKLSDEVRRSFHGEMGS